MLVPVMDKIDRAILNIINKAIPLEKQPYKKVAGVVGISEKEALERISAMKSSGIIRRFGAVIDPKAIGWVSTLCAADVPDELKDQFIALVNGYDEVTHNYLREGHPNCWFTLIAPDPSRLVRIILEIEEKLGIKLQDLPARKVFKIRVAFDIL